MTPGTIATPVTAPDSPSSADGTLTAPNETGSRKVDLVVGPCSGAGGGTFSLNPATAQVTGPVTVTVTYDPGSTTGPRSCTVYIYEMGTTTQLGSFTVTGEASRPARITLGTPPSPFPAVRVFDSAVAAHTSTRTVTVTNGGDQTLNITGLTFSGDFSLDPGSATPSTTTIAGGNSRTWTIRFDPSAAGLRTGSVRFLSDNAFNAANASETTVNLSGDGTTGAFTIAADNNGAFGTVAGGSSAALDVVVTHSGGTPKGTLTITERGVSGGSYFAISAAPTSLNGTTTTGAVTVTCSPPVGATATQTATVSVRADSDASSGTNYETKTVMVSCTGGSSALALAQSSIDFGPHLVGTTTPAQMVTITNTGTSAASVSFASNSANRFRFNLITPGNCGLTGQPNCSVAENNGTLSIMATFNPDAESTVSAGYSIGGSGGLNFILSGRGIDRHIALPEMVQVADTFRNPGTKATIAPVTIQNTGEYPINVSEVVMNGEPVWSVVDPAPFTIAGLSSVDVMVRFAPQAAGKADDGQLLLVNDDMKIADGMPIIVLSGNGKDRNVDMTPGAVDVGDTFAGIETRLSITRPNDMLIISNNEMPDPEGKSDFEIRDIAVTDEAGRPTTAFRVVDIDGNDLKGRIIAPGQTVQVDVVFSPEYVGNFESNLLLFLDEDVDSQRPVTVRGRALFADAGGSGGFGCQTGRTSRGAMLLVLAALVLVLRRPRR